ncbi:hypothetical protein HJFPF1_04385 [Paramyrothecium foliicola]|nr:hypothetical protein HJFPF1_04385 [Paramyrothecium foliicola]
MYLTAGLLTTLAVTGASAAPNAALKTRQTDPISLVALQYFTEPDCQGNLVDLSIFIDWNVPSDTCRPPDRGALNYPSWRVRYNQIYKPPVNVYSRDDCTTEDGGSVYTILPTTPDLTCVNQHVASGKFVVE